MLASSHLFSYVCTLYKKSSFDEVLGDITSSTVLCLALEAHLRMKNPRPWETSLPIAVKRAFSLGSGKSSFVTSCKPITNDDI